MRTVYLPTLIMSCCSGLIIPILPVYARSFEISYGLVGWVLAAHGLGTLIPGFTCHYHFWEFLHNK